MSAIQILEITGILVISFGWFLGSVQGQTADPENKNSETSFVIEDIFNDIMLTLPPEVKADIDSAKKSHGEIHDGDGKPVQPQSMDVSNQIHNDNRFRELPENVQKQVEKNIQEIEKNREERELQFKEMQKKKEKQ